MKTTTTVKRLRILADHLKNNVTNKKFNLDTWIANLDGNSQPKEIYKALRDQSCGTVGCAVGHATTIREFNKDGLGLVSNVYGGGYPVFKEHEGWVAIREFFGLDAVTAFELFDAERYGQPSRHNVIRRLNKVAKELEATI